MLKIRAMLKKALQAAIFGVVAMTSSLSADQNRDAREILQLLLNEPKLARYYHFDTRPERAPLKIVNRSGVEFGTPDLTAAGKKTSLVAGGGNDALVINALTIAADSAKVGFAFSPEGIVGEATFSRSQGAWTIGTVDIKER
jgi:hypothetical protein